MSDPLSRYREVEVQGARAEELVVRLYEAALRHCRAARGHHDDGRLVERGNAVSRALAIVGELQRVLDFERGGEIARELDRLYLFVSDRLVETCVDNRGDALDEAVRVLEPLYEGWVEIAGAQP